MDSNKKVCVGCLELTEQDNLVLNEKSMYWHKSCLDNFQRTPKTPQQYLQMQPGQWYSWDPDNSSTPSYPVNISDVVSNVKSNSNTNTKSKYLGYYSFVEKLKEVIYNDSLLEANQILPEETLQEKDKAWEEVIEKINEMDAASQNNQFVEESWEDIKKYPEIKHIEIKNETVAFEEFSKLQKELAEPEMMPKKKKLKPKK